MPEAPRRTFTIGPCLGRGAFGEVYRARMRSPGGLETEVAVKLLRSDVKLEEEAVLRLRDEAKVLTRLQHPAIVDVIDLVRLEGRLGLVAGHVDGADLAELAGVAGLPPRAVLEVVGRVADALAAAYATPGPDGRPLHLVHRDVKPRNVRVGRHGDVRLLDFGLAFADLGDRLARTSGASLVGTPAYLAPERFLDGRAVPAGDVWALGCTMYEVLAGGRFQTSENLREVSTLSAERPTLERFRDDRLARLPRSLPPGVRALVRDMLAWEPDRRPVPALVQARAEALAEEAAGPSLRGWCRDHPWPSAGDEGPLTGRTLVEEPLDRAGARRAPTPLSDRPAQVEKAPPPTIPPPTNEPAPPVARLGPSARPPGRPPSAGQARPQVSATARSSRTSIPALVFFGVSVPVVGLLVVTAAALVLWYVVALR